MTHVSALHTYLLPSAQHGGTADAVCDQALHFSLLCTQVQHPLAGACTSVTGRLLLSLEPGQECALHPGRHSQPVTARTWWINSSAQE